MDAAPNDKAPVTDATTDPVALLGFFNDQNLDEFDGDTKKVEGDADKEAADKKAADEAAAAKATAEKEAADKAEAEKTAAATAAATAANPDTEADAAGVLAKDGKNVIPYSVLKSARDKATEADRLLTESKAANVALTKQLEEAKAGKPAAAAPAAELTDISDEDLEALKTEFPTLAKAIVAQRTQFKALEARLTKATETQASTSQASEQATAAEQVQAVIDSIPKLAHIQATDPALWTDAIALDKTLREMPRWAGKPQADRFKRVVELLEADAGEIKLPVTGKPTPEPTQAELKAAAEKELAAKAAAPKAPTSLSDAKGGEAPLDEKSILATATPMQLQAKMARMTPDQLDEYLESI